MQQGPGQVRVRVRVRVRVGGGGVRVQLGGIAVRRGVRVVCGCSCSSPRPLRVDAPWRCAEAFLPVRGVPYCAPVTEIDTSPLVLRGRRRSVARLRAGVLSLDRGRTRRRMPVAGVERVEVGGPPDQELTVVLTAAPPSPMTYVIRARSAPMGREFAAAVSRALPVRDAGEPRVEGAGPVSERTVRRWSPSPRHRVAAGLLAACPLVRLVLWLARPGDVARPVAAGPRGGRGRGLGRDGRLREEAEGRRAAQPGDHGGGAAGVVVRGAVRGRRRPEYVASFASFASFADGRGRGRGRERHGAQGRGAERVEIVYDPEDPENDIVHDPEDAANNRVGRGTVARPAGTWLLVVLVWSGVRPWLAGVVFMAVGVVALFPWPGAGRDVHRGEGMGCRPCAVGAGRKFNNQLN